MKPSVIFGFVVVGIMAIIATPALAAAPDFLMSWSAQTNVPSWYQGAPLVTPYSSFVVGFELVETNPSQRGKLIDLSSRMVRWYVDRDLVRSGMGMQQLTISNIKIDGEDVDVRISVEYVDAVEGRTYFVDRYIAIPVVSPEVVVSWPTTRSFLASGAALMLKAFPFYFSAPDSSLSVLWSVGGGRVAGEVDPFTLLLGAVEGVTSGQTLVDVSVSNPTASGQQYAVWSDVFSIQ